MIEFEEPFVRRSVDTRRVHEYVDRIYQAILKDEFEIVRSIQIEVHADTIDFRASVWTCLSKPVRDKLRDICPELI
jgi:hypothetical protein